VAHDICKEHCAFVQYIEVHILNKWARFSHGLAGSVRHQSAPFAPCEGPSQDDLAYEAEISRSYLSQLEKGAYYASLKIVGKLAAVLDVDPEELLRVPPKKAGRR
jgi:DNA-binding XRE family transcriptional regulator